MKITYVDVDNREVIAVIDDPATSICGIGAEQFAAGLEAIVIRFLPTSQENDWYVELKIPSHVRELHLPAPGDRVRFTTHAGEGTGVYQGKQNEGYVILDEAGNEWELPGMWQITKL